MLRKIVPVIAVVVLLGLAAVAQDDFPKFEAGVDYSYSRFSPSHNYINNSYSLNGGGGSFDFNFMKYIGVKADFQGYGSNTQKFSAPAGSLVCPSGCTANVQGNLFTYMFGPQVGLRTGKFRPFGELLFGGAHSNVYGNVSKIPGIVTGSRAPSQNAFAMTVGGGLDIALNKSGSIALRPGEFDYLYTRFNTSSLQATGQSAQSSFRYVAGMIFNF
jgi:opacity protein-like surface antigen